MKTAKQKKVTKKTKPSGLGKSSNKTKPIRKILRVKAAPSLKAKTGSKRILEKTIVTDLEAQITAGRIIFDPSPAEPDKLKKQLLGKNTGTKVTELLQNLALAISKIEKIRISSIIRNEGWHGSGRAFDIGNEEIAKKLLPIIATDAKVQEMKIDEIIFDASVAGQSNRNKWNYDEGERHEFEPEILDEHNDHIHFAVMAG